MAYKVVNHRFQHEFERLLNEFERDGYKLTHFTHDEYYMGVLWRDDDA